MIKRAFFSLVILPLLFVFGITIKIYSQTCTGCSHTKTYIRDASVEVNSSNANFNRDSWDPIVIPGNDDLVRFNQNGNFSWKPSNSTTIRGIVLENNANLTLDRSSLGDNPSFIIQGSSATNKGCITVKSGSTLTLSYISNLNNIIICVEEGGKIVFDARREDRNDYLFNGVDINLQGPGAQLEFGEADIVVGTGGVSISGYSQGTSGCISNSDGSLSLPNPIPNVSADPTKTNLVDYCNFLAAAGFSIQPVEYLYFKSTFKPKQRAVELIWATAKEWENSHFEIERSHNGAKTWEKVGRMEGRGWSDMPVGYEFLDEALPLVGGNVYYRLKQVDFNGTFAYSKVVSVRVPSLQLTKGVWRVYPNPTNGEKFRIDLMDAKAYQGEKIQVRLVTSTAGDKTFTGNDIREISLQLEDFFKRAFKGVYILEISWGQKIEHIKVLKE